MHILFVEDDPNSRDTISRKLSAASHQLTIFDNSMEAIDFLDGCEPDVLLSDYRLGNVPDGLMLAGHVRYRYPHCVIILISQFANFDEAVKAMHLNVDDFIKKPIQGHELMERIYQAYTRRRSWMMRNEVPTVEISNLKIDTVQHTVEWFGKPLELTPTEFQILRLLTAKPGSVISFTTLATAISKGHIASPEEARINLKTHIKNIRRKLGVRSSAAWICSVRGEGFKWDNHAQLGNDFLLSDGRN